MSYNKYNTKSAVALGYNEQEDQAPKVIAKGKGDLAEQIIAIAKKNNILIHKDKELTQMLSVLEINSHIPLEAYSVVAEILSYIYKVNKEMKTQEGTSHAKSKRT